MLSIATARTGSLSSSATGDVVAPWHGATEAVIAAPVEKVWAIASDWLRFPRHCAVECAEGQIGVPGCVRKVKAPNSNFWVAEKLTCIDHERHIFVYDIVGGNSGIESGFRAAFQAIAEGENSTRVVWPFMFSPKQVSLESLTVVVKEKVKAHIKELEQLTQAAYET